MELRSCATAANGAGIAREHQLVHHGAAMCGRYSMTADLGELGSAIRVRRRPADFPTHLQRRSYPGSADCCGRRNPARRVHALGFDTALGQGRLQRKPDDQRQGRDGRREPSLPGCAEKAAMPRAGGRFLRVAASRASQETHARRHEVGGPLCLCGAVVGVERSGGQRPSHLAPSSRPQPTTCSGPSTTGCRWCCPVTWKGSG